MIHVTHGIPQQFMTLFLMFFFFFSFDNIWKWKIVMALAWTLCLTMAMVINCCFFFWLNFFLQSIPITLSPPFFWASFLSYLLVSHINATFSIQSSLLLCLANVGQCILSFFFFVSTLWSQIKKLSSSSSNLQNLRMRSTNPTKRRRGMDSTNLDWMIWSNAIN